MHRLQWIHQEEHNSIQRKQEKEINTMTDRQLNNRISKLQGLETQIKGLEAQAEAIRDEIKADLTEKKEDEHNTGSFIRPCSALRRAHCSVSTRSTGRSSGSARRPGLKNSPVTPSAPHSLQGSSSRGRRTTRYSLKSWATATQRSPWISTPT